MPADPKGFRTASHQKTPTTGGQKECSHVHLELVVICQVFLFLQLFLELLEFGQRVQGGHGYPWNLGQAAWRGASNRRVSAV